MCLQARHSLGLTIHKKTFPCYSHTNTHSRLKTSCSRQLSHSSQIKSRQKQQVRKRTDEFLPATNERSQIKSGYLMRLQACVCCVALSKACACHCVYEPWHRPSASAPAAARAARTPGERDQCCNFHTEGEKETTLYGP